MACSSGVRCDWRRSGNGRGGALNDGGCSTSRLSMHLEELESPEGSAAFLRLLQTRGYSLLSLPRSKKAHTVVRRAYESCSSFFAQDAKKKEQCGAGPGLGQQHGYMDMLDDTGAECFDVKKHHDRAFRWPQGTHGLQAALTTAFKLLDEVARQVLRAALVAAGLDHVDVATLLDPADGSISLANASNTSLRAWRYVRSSRDEHNKPVADWHTDNSLITVAPAGTLPGLRVRSLDGTSGFPELSMRSDQVLVFAGDALSFLTGGRVPALMHCVELPRPRPLTSTPASENGQQAASNRGPKAGAAAVSTAVPHASSAVAKRLSMPFFLRARKQAVLSPPCVDAAAPLSPLTMIEIETNARDERNAWKWKKHAYYQGARWHTHQVGLLAAN